MPEENICRKRPLAQMTAPTLHAVRRPRRSESISRKIKQPHAAPSTPKEVILPVRLARPEGLSFQWLLTRLKSSLNEVRETEEL
jgi:hypothetical protein